MFCDLASYTELSSRIDPEDLSEILAAYQQTCMRAINQFGGHVAQFLGDGLLVYFGFPKALEDAGERALRAALAIRAALGQLNEGRAASGVEPV